LDLHKKEGWKKADRNRGTSTERGYNATWRKARKMYLSRHPLCVACYAQGVYTGANVVDHITPHKGDHSLFWDEANWQSLCYRCHNQKTAKIDGGFGNAD